MNSSSANELYQHNENGVTLVKLLLHTRAVNQFLLIDMRDKIQQEQSYILSGILCIYSNYTTLINESQTDQLTGLANRKTFDTAIAKVFDGLFLDLDPLKKDKDRRSNVVSLAGKDSRYWLAMLDIDHFKSINDRYGHLYGDEILIQFAQLIRCGFRIEDLQFRFGGEEFAILFRSPSLKSARLLLERFRDNVATHRFANNNQVTVSIGAVELTKEVFYITSIDYADQALYHGKNHGRNKVTFFEDILQSGEAKTQEIDDGSVNFF